MSASVQGSELHLRWEKGMDSQQMPKLRNQWVLGPGFQNMLRQTATKELVRMLRSVPHSLLVRLVHMSLEQVEPQ